MQPSLHLEQFMFYAGVFAFSCLLAFLELYFFELNVTSFMSRIHALYLGGPHSVLVLRPAE